MKILAFVFTFLVKLTSVCSQVNFKADLKNANPVDTKLDIPSIKAKNEKLQLLLVVGFILASILGYFGYQQMWRKKKELIQNHSFLSDLTETIISKNIIIANQKEALIAQKASTSELDKNSYIEENVFNTRILTDVDYTIFKAYFEKAYPGYLINVRKKMAAPYLC